MTSLTTIPSNTRLSVEELRSNVNLIQEVMRGIMKADVHYGVIPFTDKPTLFKAGSEAILSAFRISVDPVVEDLSTPDVIRYRVKAAGVHQTTGVVVGYGIGECSTNEEKYKWRKAVCIQEFEATPETHRRVKYANGKGGKHYTVDQVRTNPADLANTVLKMAKKRAQIDLTLTSTAASDIFGQDVEDLPAEYVESLSKEEREEVAKLPAYPQQKIEENSKAWRTAILDPNKKTTVHGVLSKLQSAYTLTEEQIKQIKELEKSE